MDQRRYAEQVLARFGVTEANQGSTQVEHTSLQALATEDETSNEGRYAEAVGLIMRITTMIRPDLDSVSNEAGLDELEAGVLEFCREVPDVSFAYLNRGVFLGENLRASSDARACARHDQKAAHKLVPARCLFFLGRQGATQENLSERFPDVSAEELMKALNELVKRVGAVRLTMAGFQSLLEFLQRGSQPLFRPINVDVADKMIYNVIRESDNEGVWTKIIKNKTNLHQNVVTKCIKSLTHKGFIKAVKSVKVAAPSLLFFVYMLAEITPSHETTGGVWFTDSELDTEFVNRLCSKALQ
ncbi:MAG: RNA polymerase Rpc34 subunit-domain-containing protein, partial [Olpidium bornovanus]